MKTIYLVRHGETESNISNLVQDGTSALSEKGKQQAKVLSERLRHLKHSHILVSDFIRTRQTAEPLLAHLSTEPVFTALLREITPPTQFVGTFNGSDEYLSYKKIQKENFDNPEWHFEDEENFFDIRSRVGELINYIDTLEGDTIAISHGRFISFLTMYIITSGNLTPDIWLNSVHNLEMTNTGITAICFNDKRQHWVLKTFNDHAHFAE